MADILTASQQFKTPQEALAHYGVKGMKWGVRKDDSGAPAPKKERGKIRRGLTKWGEAADAGNRTLQKTENQLKALLLPEETQLQIQSDMGSYMTGAALGARKDPRFRGIDLKRDPKAMAEYRKMMEGLAEDYYKQRLTEEYTLLGLEAARSATRAAIDFNKQRMTVREERRNAAQHADEPTVTYDLEIDEKGFITDFKAVETELEHSSYIEVGRDAVSAILNSRVTPR